MQTLNTFSLKQQTLLAFLAASPDDAVDAVRIMKGIFLLSQKARPETLPAEERYEFEPYHYGPCSFAIYDDLRAFESFGLIKTTNKIGESWQRYQVTSQGIETARSSELSPRLWKYIQKLNNYVRSLSFSELLKKFIVNFLNMQRRAFSFIEVLS